jgi:hypothetical protein
MRATLLSWSAVVVLLFAGFGASVVALNESLYSAHGFVGRYLEALERGDSAAALDLPGVRTTNQASTEMLVGDAMGELGDVRVTDTSTDADGAHTVVVEYELDGSGETSTSSFVVARDGTAFGLFPRWRFVQSPLTTVSVTVLHDQRFTANGHDLTAPEPGVASTYQVFAPGHYVFDHETEYLAAADVPVAVTEIGGITDVAVDVQANEAFVEEVQTHVSAYLEECTTQDVLMPTGCPFGKQVLSVVTGAPEWSMVTDPVIAIVPGEAPGTWAVPRVQATAHLVVPVRSYFDGVASTLDEDVLFSVAYTLTFEANRQLLITAVYE